MNNTTKVLRAKRLIDGTGVDPIEDNPIVIVKGSKILDVGPESSVDLPQNDATELNFSELTLLPGLIDQHIHLGLPADGRPYEQMMEDSDGVLLLAAMKNAQKSLNIGLTTVADCGTRNQILFDLKMASERGLIQTPRLFICGRPLTITGGHFWFCNNNEMDGPDEIRKGVRGILKEGADFIKIMASGGGTVNTDAKRASFSAEELKVFVEESQRFGVITKAHCLSTASILNAIEAGIHCIEHIGFIDADGTRSFYEDAVRDIIKKGIYVSPTIQTGFRQRQRLLEKEKQQQLSEKEKNAVESLGYKHARKLENLAKLHQMGVKLLAGSDAGCGMSQTDDFVFGLELMVRAGMTPREVVFAATQKNAEALQLQHSIGSLERGKEADIIAVRGNPFEDISVLRNVELVMVAGRMIKQVRTS
jgi:imidazolonepropionase-like amidohydrolase